MAKLSLEELKAAVSSYVASASIGVSSFSETRNNVVDLLDKIGKITTLDTTFFDKLPELDGEELSFGKTVEEYYQDLIETIDYNQDLDGSRALKFYSPTYRPVAYSYSLGKKVIPSSIPNNNIERAVHFEAQLVEIVSLMYKRMSDSAAVWKYQVKRELLGKICDKIIGAYGTDATSYVNATTDIVEGTFYKQSTNKHGVCVKSKTHAVGDTWATLVAGGYLIDLQMLEEIAIPVDDTTGEAFIEAVKKSVEIAQDVSEGYSFNGNTIGAEVGLSLYVKQGVMPSLEVKTMAGAFNLEKLAMNVEAKVIRDFGATTSKVFAILMDRRAARLHIDYEAVRENFNGFGDFLNLFHHLECTCFASRNAFIKVFVEPEA